MNCISKAFVTLVLFISSSSLTLAQDDLIADENAILSYAFALRTATLDYDYDAIELLSLVPGTSALIDLNTPDDESTAKIADLWIPFFQNVMVEINDRQPDRPAVLYYNPLVDVGLYILWKRDLAEGFEIEHIRAFPGERLGNLSPEVFNVPEWMLSEEPFQELLDIVTLRRQAFVEYDYFHREPIDTNGSYKEASEEFIAVAHRLVEESIQRVEWADFKWLASTLLEIQTLLIAHDTSIILATAPGTSLAVAEFLSELPDESISDLVLDKVIAGQNGSRLLIGSNPQDGTTFIWVICQLFGGVCELSQFAILSLVDSI